MTAADSRSGRCLQVVSAPSRSLIEPDTVGLSLTSAPFRPGELPVLWWAQLGATEREVVARRATQDSVPAPLWLRTAVESARLVAEIVATTGSPTDAVVATLDAASSNAAGRRDVESMPGPLDRYADLLARGDRAGDVGAEIVLRLSDEMAGTWRRAAIAARTPIPAWISARLTDAPASCVEWEIAAARACRTLAEWAYASALRSMTSSRA